MDAEAPAVTCSLTTKALAAQALEWSDAADLAIATVPLPNGSVARYPIAEADRIEDLAAREAGCCGSWMDISTERTETELRLRVTTTNPEGVELIHLMTGCSPS